MRTRRFFWGLVLGTLYFLFLYLMSLAQKDGVTEDTKRLLSVLAMCTLSGMAGGMVS
jgi:putative membrane protein (TIGR04086 family)